MRFLSPSGGAIPIFAAPQNLRKRDLEDEVIHPQSKPTFSMRRA